MLKSHVLLLAEAYHFLAHWKEIVCMSSVLCVSSIDGMHTFPVWMQIHFHLFLGIVIIPHHTYSSTYTRTRPLARVVWNPFRIAGVALWILSGCPKMTSLKECREAYCALHLREPHCARWEKVVAMRSSRISACVHEKELSVPRTLMTIHCLSARMVMVMLNFKAEHSAKKRRVCIIFLDLWVCPKQGLPVSPNPPVFSDVFRMGNFLGVPHFWRAIFFHFLVWSREFEAYFVPLTKVQRRR